MKQFRERVKRAIWTYRQPLTKVPSRPGAPVSDLFVWINNADWQTCFELMDIPGLFDGPDSGEEATVIFFFFDAKGEKLKTVELRAHKNARYCVNLSEHLTDVAETHGTFCVFHAFTPAAVSYLGSFVAERGYVSYRYRNAGLRSYVHGNLDAVALIDGTNLEMLGSNSFLRRTFNLQCAITGDAEYKLVLVNPTSKTQMIESALHDADNGKLTDEWRVELSPRACHIFDIPFSPDITRLARIRSHLVMARPVVFRISNQKLDVFHG